MTKTGAGDTTTADPRWGQCGREGKGEAILRTLQRQCGEDVARGTWLDIGCGSGGIAAALAPHVTHMCGIDPEPWQRWQAFREQYSNLEFHVGSWRDLPQWLGDAAVDVVVCNQVYEHVDDAAGLVQAIARVLKPGGVCYFAGPNLLWPIEPHVFWPFVHWLPRAFAQRLMRALGSRHASELDAYSAHYWRLRRWFRAAALRYENAIRARLLAALSGSRLVSALVRVVVTKPLLRVLTPVAPGFIFILCKPDVAEPST